MDNNIDKKKQFKEYKKDLCKAFLTLKTEKEVEIFLDDVCTIKEIQDMSQRLHVAKMLSDGKVFNEICGVTGSSSATISRVNKCLMYGDGGYNLVLDRMKDNQQLGYWLFVYLFIC